jgi:hypothetical protein
VIASAASGLIASEFAGGRPENKNFDKSGKSNNLGRVSFLAIICVQILQMTNRPFFFFFFWWCSSCSNEE